MGWLSFLSVRVDPAEHWWTRTLPEFGFAMAFNRTKLISIRRVILSYAGMIVALGIFIGHLVTINGKFDISQENFRLFVLGAWTLNIVFCIVYVGSIVLCATPWVRHFADCFLSLMHKRFFMASWYFFVFACIVSIAVFSLLGINYSTMTFFLLIAPLTYYLVSFSTWYWIEGSATEQTWPSERLPNEEDMIAHKSIELDVRGAFANPDAHAKAKASFALAEQARIATLTKRHFPQSMNVTIGNEIVAMIEAHSTNYYVKKSKENNYDVMSGNNNVVTLLTSMQPSTATDDDICAYDQTGRLLYLMYPAFGYTIQEISQEEPSSDPNASTISGWYVFDTTNGTIVATFRTICDTYASPPGSF
ncbi:MAG: hypothetical protein ABW189_09085 [Rickettsiales bacterium]